MIGFTEYYRIQRQWLHESAGEGVLVDAEHLGQSRLSRSLAFLSVNWAWMRPAVAAAVLSRLASTEAHIPSSWRS